MKNQSIRNQFSSVFNLIAENQSVVFEKQSIVYINSVEIQAKADLKSVRIERLT